MQIETFLLADSASDYRGRLCILGAFDSIKATQLPAVHRHSSIVLRLRFEQAEQGEHNIKIVMIDEDGKQLMEVQAKTNVTIKSGRESAAINLVLGLNDMRFPTFGTYHFDLVIDGQLRARLPLLLETVKPVQQAA